jgi:hypothetical protein
MLLENPFQFSKTMAIYSTAPTGGRHGRMATPGTQR